MAEAGVITSSPSAAPPRPFRSSGDPHPGPLLPREGESPSFRALRASGWPAADLLLREQSRNGPLDSVLRFRRHLVGAGRKPAVEVVENPFDSRQQLVGDLVLALTLAGAPSRLADDDLEDAGERDSLQPGDLGCDCGRIADRVGDGVGLAV